MSSIGPLHSSLSQIPAGRDQLMRHKKKTKASPRSAAIEREREPVRNRRFNRLWVVAAVPVLLFAIFSVYRVLKRPSWSAASHSAESVDDSRGYVDPQVCSNMSWRHCGEFSPHGHGAIAVSSRCIEPYRGLHPQELHLQPPLRLVLHDGGAGWSLLPAALSTGHPMRARSTPLKNGSITSSVRGTRPQLPSSRCRKPSDRVAGYLVLRKSRLLGNDSRLRPA